MGIGWPRRVAGGFLPLASGRFPAGSWCPAALRRRLPSLSWHSRAPLRCTWLCVLPHCAGTFSR